MSAGELCRMVQGEINGLALDKRISINVTALVRHPERRLPE
jgi:hypothetical protein